MGRDRQPPLTLMENLWGDWLEPFIEALDLQRAGLACVWPMQKDYVLWTAKQKPEWLDSDWLESNRAWWQWANYWGWGRDQ